MRIHTVQFGKAMSLKDLQSLSQAASKFQADVYLYLQNDSIKIDVKSLLGLMLQSIPAGYEATVETSGADELEALEAISTIIMQGD
ncbi:HPr family phosphocarrier protein [Gorillibacterium massiliense]|uniref:HPr family phosphocarrier protein n=1 Tax=Gorillibacterium massiliense TaxID=1280390 RepID=UPI0004AE050E|nr:HPr family phosphocarrier protein [Gorillibacterium massiliense]